MFFFFFCRETFLRDVCLRFTILLYTPLLLLDLIFYITRARYYLFVYYIYCNVRTIIRNILHEINILH